MRPDRSGLQVNKSIAADKPLNAALGSKMKRNIVREITERKTRNSASDRIFAFSERHRLIGESYRRLVEIADPSGTTVDPELCRYFPVALVAAVEGYYRKCVADLVNSGVPYQQRAAEIRNLRPNTETKEALKKEQISHGDHIAHFISIGSLDDVNRVLSALVGFDFLERILTSDFHLFEEDDPLTFRESDALIIEAARELFHTRHMLCHEFAPNVQPDIADILRMLAVTDTLVALSEVILICVERGEANE